LTQDSGDEQELFGIALTVILISGPVLIIAQTASTIFKYLTFKPPSDDSEGSDDRETINTLKNRRRQVPIASKKDSKKARGSVSYSGDLESGNTRLPPKGLVIGEDHISPGRQPKNGATAIDQKEDVAPLGMSLDSGYTTSTPMSRRRPSFEIDSEAMMFAESGSTSLRQRLAVRKAMYPLDDSESEYSASRSRTRLALRKMALPTQSETASLSSPQLSSQPKFQDTETEDNGGAPATPQNDEDLDKLNKLIFNSEDHKFIDCPSSTAQREAVLHEEEDIKAKCVSTLESFQVDTLDRSLFKGLIKTFLLDAKITNEFPSEEDLDRVFFAVDDKGSGLIDKGELLVLCNRFAGTLNKFIEKLQHN
jgi:hypothetical protein